MNWNEDGKPPECCGKGVQFVSLMAFSMGSQVSHEKDPPRATVRLWALFPPTSEDLVTTERH